MKIFKHTIFLSFLSSSFILVLVNIITLISVSFISNREQFDLEMNKVTVELEKSLELIDSRFQEIGNMAMRLSKDQEIVDTIRITPPLENKHYSTLYRLDSRFNHYNQQTTFIDQVFIIFKKSGIVITDFGTSPNVEVYARNFFSYENYPTYDKWVNDIDLWNKKASFLPTDKVTTMNNLVQAITYRYPITVGMSSPGAVFIALIPVKNLEFYFQDLIDQGCVLKICDNQENILYLSNEQISKDTYTVLTVKSNNVQIGLTVPHSYINDNLRSNNTFFVAILIVNLLIITIIAILLAKKDSKPLEKLMAKINSYVPEQSKPHSDSYQWLENSLEKILGDKSDTEATITKQWGRLRTGFYEQLIRGSFADEDEIEEYLASVNLPVPTGPHYVALISVVPQSNEGQPDPTALKVILHTYIAKHSFKEWHHHQNGLGEVLVIPAHSSYEDFLIKNQEELYKSTGVVTHLCLGCPRETLFDLKDSFDEARKVLVTSRRSSNSPKTFHYSTYKTLNHSYHYDKKDNEQLVNAVHSGDLEKVKKCLDQIMARNYDYEEIPTSGLMRLFSDITTSVCEIIRKKGQSIEGIPVNYNRYLELYSSPEDFHSRIINLLSPIIEYLNGDKKSHNSTLLGDIKEYIHQFYTDPMLCQSGLAGHFKLNPQYVSRFFKEQTGESFSSYLEKLRMEEAIRIMENREEEHTLKEIAELSGYLSWNSFYKAFKRNFGITPGDYKKQSQAG